MDDNKLLEKMNNTLEKFKARYKEHSNVLSRIEENVQSLNKAFIDPKRRKFKIVESKFPSVLVITMSIISLLLLIIVVFWGLNIFNKSSINVQ